MATPSRRPNSHDLSSTLQAYSYRDGTRTPDEAKEALLSSTVDPELGPRTRNDVLHNMWAESAWTGFCRPMFQGFKPTQMPIPKARGDFVDTANLGIVEKGAKHHPCEPTSKILFPCRLDQSVLASETSKYQNVWKITRCIRKWMQTRNGGDLGTIAKKLFSNQQQALAPPRSGLVCATILPGTADSSATC